MSLLESGLNTCPALMATSFRLDNYNQAAVISGDGDFVCLYEFLKKNGKLGRIIAPAPGYSRLLLPYKSQIIDLSNLRTALEYRSK